MSETLWSHALSSPGTLDIQMQIDYYRYQYKEAFVPVSILRELLEEAKEEESQRHVGWQHHLRVDGTTLYHSHGQCSAGGNELLFLVGYLPRQRFGFFCSRWTCAGGRCGLRGKIEWNLHLGGQFCSES